LFLEADWASFLNSSFILASRFLRAAMSNGEVPVFSNLRMFVSRARIAGLSDIANRRDVSRSLLWATLAM
jgi:hypothetical protein